MAQKRPSSVRLLGPARVLLQFDCHRRITGGGELDGESLGVLRGVAGGIRLAADLSVSMVNPVSGIKQD